MLELAAQADAVRHVLDADDCAAHRPGVVGERAQQDAGEPELLARRTPESNLEGRVSAVDEHATERFVE